MTEKTYVVATRLADVNDVNYWMEHDTIFSAIKDMKALNEESDNGYDYCLIPIPTEDIENARPAWVNVNLIHNERADLIRKNERMEQEIWKLRDDLANARFNNAKSEREITKDMMRESLELRHERHESPEAMAAYRIAVDTVTQRLESNIG